MKCGYLHNIKRISVSIKLFILKVKNNNNIREPKIIYSVPTTISLNGVLL